MYNLSEVLGQLDSENALLSDLLSERTVTGITSKIRSYLKLENIEPEEPDEEALAMD